MPAADPLIVALPDVLGDVLEDDALDVLDGDVLEGDELDGDVLLVASLEVLEPVVPDAPDELLPLADPIMALVSVQLPLVPCRHPVRVTLFEELALD